jgi:hypothetical protein
VIPPLPFYNGKQTVNPDVFRPEHPAHESAVTAVRALGAALGEPQFADLAVRRLFPPPRPVLGELVLHARENWVLFHRRRDKQCAAVETPHVGVFPRRYRIYLVSLDDKKNREALHQALAANAGAAVNAFRPQPVSVVEFAAGIPSLETAAATVRADWQARVKGVASITYGAVASQGTALDEGTDLASARLAALAHALESVTAVGDDVQLETLPTVPDASAITASPYDGVMVLATVPLPTLCHQVYRLNAAKAEELIRAMKSTPAAGVEKLLTSLQAQRLGQATFLEGTDQLVAAQTDDLVTAWTQKGNGTIPRVVLISQRLANPTDADKARIKGYQAQAARIAAQLGAVVPSATITYAPPRDTEPIQPCPAITVLAAAARD